jgi:D-alanyl-D-alanine endopeptidase (penicillin-binding protein 7)
MPQGAPTLLLDGSKLKLASSSVLVLDATAGHSIYSKAADTITPIASVTKLMTAMVVLDGGQPLDEMLSVSIADLDLLRGSHSRLRLGSELSRGEMLRVALMASENRAASSLARHYPGGLEAFVAAMNKKAADLGMVHSHFSDATGLSSENVSTANEVGLMVKAAANYPLIRDATTTSSAYVEVQPTGALLGFNNTNSLVRGGEWDIQVSKDRIHPRGWEVPGHADDHRQPPDRHRAAGFGRQADTYRRCQSRQALARDRRSAACNPKDQGCHQTETPGQGGERRSSSAK